MNNNFKHHLIAILLKDDRLKDEQGELKGNLVKEFVNTLDENLITILLEDEKTRAQFFLKIKDAYVFKTNEFKFFLDENSIDNSFTQYSNQIGLATGGKFLKNNTDVVLNFPFKDCVLEGGQSTEDGLDTYFEFDDEKQDYAEKQSKRKEIFFNEVLAKDEIDRLLEPKAFTNITKYDSKGKSKPTKFNRNAKGTITDSLIIKGNNLLALHSLKQEFKGKVKLIYIDPPYNTGDDEFAYNDNFNHSTWLTFMHNRLEAAKELLSENGFLFIQINDIESSYLQILTDEVFKRENFLTSICVKMSHLSGTKMAHKDKKIPKIKEHILMYANNKSNVKLNPHYIPTTWENAFSRYKSFIVKNGLSDEDCSKWEIITLNEALINNNIDKNIKKDLDKFLIDNAHLIFRTARNRSADYTKLPSNVISKFTKDSKKPEKYHFVYKGEDISLAEDKIRIFNGKRKPSTIVGDIWTDIGINNLSNEGGVSLRFGKKPEKLISRIIALTTSINDIVLDYHLGSGTTAAVAHKMNRQYIGIEQLDYGKNDSVQRLKNVIDSEQSGVSKAYEWKGGGSFVYLELAKNNQTAKEEILKCKNLEELLQFFETMYTKYFLHYNVRIKQFKEVISQEENFKNLALERQKEIFSKMLDLNQLYVNQSEIEDSRYQLDAKDIGLSKDFYQIKK
jgi:adenine-specific DNA-methyltransferase